MFEIRKFVYLVQTLDTRIENQSFERKEKKNKMDLYSVTWTILDKVYSVAKLS